MNHPLPRGWQEKKLIDFSPLQRGFDLPNSKIINGEYPIVYSNGIKAYHNEYKCKGVGVVTGRSGTIGKVTYVEKDYWPHNTSLWVTDFKGNLPKFVFYLLSYIDLSKYDAGTSVPTLNRNDVHKITVLVPPLDEQNRIAEVLSLCDKLIENLTKLIEKKEIYKKGVMQRVLTGKVRFNGFTDEWETVRLGDIATITSAGVDKKINDNETKVRLLNYLDVFNRNKLYDNEISFITSANENQIKKCDIKKGDLFITPSSEDREGIAKSAVAMEDFTNVVYSYHIIRLRFNREIDLKFKSYMCDTALFHRQAYRLCDGSGQRYVISLGTFREMEIYIPKSVEEQKKIGELLSLIDQDIDNLKQLLHLRKLQKKGLMQKLLTGEVRI